MTAPKIASPLSRKAVLVSVNISQWTARKLDKKITKETNTRYTASADAGRYNKLLIDAKHLARLNRLVSDGRRLHYQLTRPWADEGPRILPNVLYSKFTDEFRVLKREFAQAADDFAASYPSYVTERAKQLNGAFNQDDYPAADSIREKFSMELQILPFPDAGDFRSDLDEETVEDIRSEISASTSRVVDDAMKATAKQIIETVGHMSAKLKEYNGGKKGEPRRFFLDSLVENVRELGMLLPAFNLTNDPKLDAIAKRIAGELTLHDASELRKDDNSRRLVAKSADQIVAEVETFFA